MSITRRQAAGVESQNKPIYRSSFVQRAHCVLQMGYDLLDAAAFCNSQEEDITGELTRSMQTAVEGRDAPRWAKNFWASEEVRVADDSRLGKRRKRIDIEIIQHQAGPRPRFRIEAKRLHSPASRRDYLGEDGLGCFLDGRYAKKDQMAGMLGYVQEGTLELHAEAIGEFLKKKPTKYAVAPNGGWAKATILKDLATYRSVHGRVKPLPAIVILHTLLSFC